MEFLVRYSGLIRVVVDNYAIEELAKKAAEDKLLEVEDLDIESVEEAR